MRPRRLTIAAFGPYADPQVVDFDSLRDDGLFLIHGATGSGKTFLLDALSFALYGEVAGGRAVVSLRSDHADPAAEPIVTLDFEAQGERWLIERVPAHQRLGLRSDTLVDKPARASLSRRDGTAWQPAASGVKEVSLRVLALIGLTAKQFRQVIVLPQGAVEAVLRATSETREELLKTLFDSVLYESVAQHLDRRAKEAAIMLGTAETDLARLRDQARDRWLEVAPTTTTGGSELETAAEIGSEAEAGSAIGAIGDQQGLDQLAATADARATEAMQVTAAAEQRADDAVRLRDELGDRARRVARRLELQARHDTLHAAGHEIADQRRLLELADAAEALRPNLVEVATADRASVHATTGVAHAHETFAAAVRATRSLAAVAANEAVQRLAVAPPAAILAADLDATRDTLTVARTEVHAVVDVAELRRSLLDEAERADADANRLDQRVAAAATSRTELAATETTLRARLHHVATVAGQFDGLEAAARAAAGRAAAASRLEAARALVEHRRSDHLRADRTLQDARTVLNDRRAAYLDGIAAVLAGHLRDDQPCLVCGSDRHPAPAEAAAGAIDAEDIAIAETAVDVAQADERSTERALLDAVEAERRLRAEAGTAADDVDLAIEHAEAAIGLVADAAAILETRAAVEDDLVALALAADTEQRTLDTDAPAAAVRREQATSCRVRAAAGADHVREILGDDDPSSAAAAIDALLAALVELAHGADQLRDAERARDDAHQRLVLGLTQSPFPDVDTTAAALLPAPDRADRRAAIAAHDRNLAEVRALLEAPELADLDDSASDPASTMTAVAAAADAAVEARAARAQGTRLGDAASAIADLARRHRDLDLAVRDHREQAEITARVADQCMGRNDDRVSLQRWVLASYLEEICELATRRLLTMTSHRYSLRVHRERAGRGAKSGLDLRVFDAYTGEERTVQSLSGGETFQASLALALAVADSVQQHTGGVHLDALFVDEGFGALDPQALELALDELDQLRSGGRMVGVISHVAALRERIRVGIEVTGSTRGSHVRVGEVAAA